MKQRRSKMNGEETLPTNKRDDNSINYVILLCFFLALIVVIITLYLWSSVCRKGPKSKTESNESPLEIESKSPSNVNPAITIKHITRGSSLKTLSNKKANDQIERRTKSNSIIEINSQSDIRDTGKEQLERKSDTKLIKQSKSDEKPMATLLAPIIELVNSLSKPAQLPTEHIVNSNKKESISSLTELKRLRTKSKPKLNSIEAAVDSQSNKLESQQSALSLQLSNLSDVIS